MSSVDLEYSRTGQTGQIVSSTLDESFVSALLEPTLIAPTSMDQCKDGGWQNFPQFENQGQCVSFVARQQRVSDEGSGGGA